ncbi:MAG: sulfatase-like hydrolase/transferase [Planctomycetota bacterium]|nr:sulfatase-like hydrolase/transferase [Planctomycetota bacterium]
MKAVVITFDRLPTAVLGCYGNDWIETPNFDGLATESTLYERCYAELVWNGASQPSWWTGRYCFPKPQADWSRFEVFEQFRSAGIRTCCIADADAIPDPELMPPFDELHVIESADKSIRQRMDEVTALVGKRLDALSDDASWLMWLAFPGLSGTPHREFLQVYAEEFEDLEMSPDDAAEIVAELQRLPDPLHGLWELDSHVADVLIAAETSQFDVALGRILAKFRGANPTVIVTAAVGGRFFEVDADGPDRIAEPSSDGLVQSTPSGDETRLHQAADATYGRLCDQLTHVPCLIRASKASRGTRDQTIVQSVDLLPTLASLFEIPATITCDGMSWLGSGTDEVVRRGMAVIGDQAGNRAVRNDEYLFVSSANESIQLYVKPDDVWDIHDESEQAPDDVQRLKERLTAFEQSLLGGLWRGDVFDESHVERRQI